MTFPKRTPICSSVIVSSGLCPLFLIPFPFINKAPSHIVYTSREDEIVRDRRSGPPSVFRRRLRARGSAYTKA